MLSAAHRRAEDRLGRSPPSAERGSCTAQPEGRGGARWPRITSAERRHGPGGPIRHHQGCRVPALGASSADNAPGGRERALHSAARTPRRSPPPSEQPTRTAIAPDQPGAQPTPHHRTHHGARAPPGSRPRHPSSPHGHGTGPARPPRRRGTRRSPRHPGGPPGRSPTAPDRPGRRPAQPTPHRRTRRGARVPPRGVRAPPSTPAGTPASAPASVQTRRQRAIAKEKTPNRARPTATATSSQGPAAVSAKVRRVSSSPLASSGS